MKKHILWFLLAFAGFAMNSCKEDVDLVGDFKETAVLYGLLDQADSIHYIKLQRAFIGPGNSLEIAQIPDSNYFQDAEIVITEVIDNVVTRTWTLEDTTVSNKNPNGVFFAPNQKLYMFKAGGSFGAPLQPGALYRLKASVKGGSIVVTGETELVDGLNYPYGNQVFKFAQDPGEYTTQSFSFTTGDAYVVNLKMNVFYSEHTATDTIIRSYEQTIGELDVEPESSYSISMNGQRFYEGMRDNVEEDPNVIRRNIEGIELVLTGGSDVLYKYMLANEPSSSLSESKPSYTNLEITEGASVVGIFTSRQTYRFYKTAYQPSAPALRLIDQKSTRELCIGAITGNLLFCSQHPSDNSTSFNCP